MAVTPVGNPYVESSDLVANYPGASEALAERIDIVGVNPFANAAARDAAIPSPVQGQMCSLNDDNKGYRYDGSEWILFSGAGPANFTNTATGTYTTGGIDYKYITFTGSGSLVVDRAGFADVFALGGGGSGDGSGGGGAGGGVFVGQVYLPAATLTATVGAGGAARGDRLAGIGGNPTGLQVTTQGYICAGIGGAGAGGQAAKGQDGGNGGGAGGSQDTNSNGGSAVGLTGYAGGNTALNPAYAGGGGGGSGGAGGNNSSLVGGAGGSGLSNSYTGSAVTRGGGGSGTGDSSVSGSAGAAGSGGGGAGNASGNGAAGTVNLGGGGGAGKVITAIGGAGGSGLLIVRVVV